MILVPSKNFREICVLRVPASPGLAGTGASAKTHAQYSN
jgi:hypothetical protein